MVSIDLINRSIEGAIKYKAITTAIPVVDSIKQIAADKSVEMSLSREKLVSVQTPQVFTYDLLRRAHESSVINATDDSSLVETIHSVYVVEGERTNIKITSPEDRLVAEMLLKIK